MKPLPHRYECALAAGPQGYLHASSPGLPSLPLAAPADFDGPGDAWSPEHLLLASVQACLALTFRAVAKVSKLPFASLDVQADGTVDKAEGQTRFTAITLRARLTVPPGVDHDRARTALERSESVCLISASLSTPVHLETTVVETSADSPPAPEGQ